MWIPIPNTRSRPRIPNPGVDFPSPERYGVYIAAIYTPTSPLVSRRATIPGWIFPPERDGVYIAAIYTPTSPLVSRRTPPPSHLAVPSLLVLRFPRRCYPLPPPCRQGPLRHPLAAIVRPEPRGDSSAGTSGRIDKIGFADLSGEARMARDGGSSPQVRRGTASITRRSYRQPLECLLGRWMQFLHQIVSTMKM